MTAKQTEPTLVMARRAQVLGHQLERGQALKVVAEPTEPGEVTEEVAGFLKGRNMAVAEGTLPPTPIMGADPAVQPEPVKPARPARTRRVAEDDQPSKDD